MPVLKYSETAPERIADGLERRLVYTKSLMTAVIDFSNGPKTEPDPPHSHFHEQTSYIVEGEVLFFMDGEEPVHLKPGDLFYIPSGVAHCIQLLTPTARLVDSFTPIREEFIKTEAK